MPCHEQGSRLAARKDHAFARAILYFFRLCDSVGITTLRETADNPPSRPLEIPRRPGERNVMECPPFNQRSLHSRSAFPRRHRSRLWRKIVRYEKERSSSAFSERKGTSFIGVSEPKGTGFVRGFRTKRNELHRRFRTKRNGLLPRFRSGPEPQRCCRTGRPSLCAWDSQ